MYPWPHGPLGESAPQLSNLRGPTGEIPVVGALLRDHSATARRPRVDTLYPSCMLIPAPPHVPMISPLAALAVVLVSAPAQAEPAMVQAAVFPEALEQATAFLGPRTLSFERKELSTPLSCWDRVGVENLNFTVEIEEISLTLVEGGVRIYVDLGTVGGRQMALFAHDPKDSDNCGDIDAMLQFIELRDGSVDLSLGFGVGGDGGLDVAVLAGPYIGGDLDMDIDWAPSWAADWGWDLWPDDLFLWLLEDSIFDMAAEAGAAMIPTLADTLLAETSFSTTVGKLSVDAGLAELSASPEALRAGADLDIAWKGKHGCEGHTGEPRYRGRRPQLDLSPAGDAVFGVGVTEYLLNHVGYQAWSDGLFCLTADDIDDLITENLPDVDPRAERIEASVALGAPPVVMFDEGRVSVDLAGLQLRLSGQHAGQKVPVLSLDADLLADIGVELDEDLGAFVLSVDELVFVVQDLDSQHFLSDEPDAEARFVDFLEKWLPKMASKRVDGLPVGVSVLRVMDWIVKVDGLDLSEGGLGVALALYTEGDPAVDTVPPEAHAELVAATSHSVTVALTGTDDASLVAHRVRLDGGAWSTWSLDPEVEVEVDEPGEHLLEVEARDAWHNLDPTPARLAFDLEEAQRELAPVRACSSAGAAPAGLLVALLPLAGLLRRRLEG